jgi:thiol-disulfide isomerase/thioredoxin
MTVGAWVLVVAVGAALAFGGYRAATDGRFRGDPSRPVAGAPPTSGTEQGRLVAELGEELGERATLLQFSSAFCAPCRATRRVLSDIAEVVPGVVHVEVDAEQHLDAVRRLDVARTPTTLVLDASGREVSRASGAPRKEQVLAALAQAADPA